MSIGGHFFLFFLPTPSCSLKRTKTDNGLHWETESSVCLHHFLLLSTRMHQLRRIENHATKLLGISLNMAVWMSLRAWSWHHWMTLSWSIRRLQVSGEIVGAGNPVEVFPVMVYQFSFPSFHSQISFPRRHGRVLFGKWVEKLEGHRCSTKYPDTAYLCILSLSQSNAKVFLYFLSFSINGKALGTVHQTLEQIRD